MNLILANIPFENAPKDRGTLKNYITQIVSPDFSKNGILSLSTVYCIPCISNESLDSSVRGIAVAINTAPAQVMQVITSSRCTTALLKNTMEGAHQLVAFCAAYFLAVERFFRQGNHRLLKKRDNVIRPNAAFL